MDKSTFQNNVLEAETTMYRISMSMLQNEADCADAVSEAILKAFEKLPSLRNERYFKTWLIRILINECNKILRSKQRFAPLDEETGFCENDYSDLYEALNKLDTKLRLTVTLYYMEGYSVEEIKNILKIPAGTVKSRLARGRKLLKAHLEV